MQLKEAGRKAENADCDGGFQISENTKSYSDCMNCDKRVYTILKEYIYKKALLHNS